MINRFNSHYLIQNFYVIIKLLLVVSTLMALSRFGGLKFYVPIFLFCSTILLFKFRWDYFSLSLKEVHVNFGQLFFIVLFLYLFLSINLGALLHMGGGAESSYFRVLMLSLLVFVPLVLLDSQRFFGLSSVSVVQALAGLMLCSGLLEMLLGQDIFPSRFADSGTPMGMIATGPFYQENDFTAMLVCFFPLILWGLPNRWMFIVYKFFYTFGLLLILLCGTSRAALVVFVFLVVVFFLCWSRSTYPMKSLFACLGLLSTVVLLVLFAPGSSVGELEALFRSIVNSSGDRSFDIRVSLIAIALQSSLENFFFGFGDLPTYVAYAQKRFALGLADPHFFWTELMVVAGLIPFTIFFVSYLCMLVYHMIVCISHRKGSNYSFMVLMVAAAFFLAAHGASSTLKYAWVWLMFYLTFNSKIEVFRYEILRN